MIIKKSTRQKIEEEILETLSKSILDISSKKEFVVIGLCGGESFSNIYLKMASSDIDFKKVHFFLVDERKVLFKSNSSNSREIYELLVKPLVKRKKLSESQFHNPNLKKSTLEYSKQLKKYGGRFDIAFLGVGEDGHIASLFPDSKSLQSNAKYYIDVEDSPKSPRRRLTASLNLIINSNIVFGLFLGKKKLVPFDRFNDPNVHLKQLPCKIFKEIKNSYVYNSED